ncbi:c-type cytochrome [Hymenobacter piscis]|uniref:c-type cytochrome n=1 Tax=Hymenobacter piscis TaxID=2839984 RepID=UPI001FE799C4|nr:cytochrome c [Hymenobacter piscis]
MSKNLLEIVMPASLTVVAGAIGLCLVMLGGELTGTQVFEKAQPLSLADDVVEMAPFADSVSMKAVALSEEQSASVAAGNALFKGNCAQCHAANEVIVGPALAGVRKRRPESWLRAWVRNSSKLVASGDEYAVKIFNQYQKQQMPSFQLSDEEISQILDYVETYETRATDVVVVVD